MRCFFQRFPFSKPGAKCSAKGIARASRVERFAAAHRSDLLLSVFCYEQRTILPKRHDDSLCTRFQQMFATLVNILFPGQKAKFFSA